MTRFLAVSNLDYPFEASIGKFDPRDIKRVLEIIAKEGDLKDEATRILERKK